MDEQGQYIQIEGTVAALVYQNADNGYAVLRLDTPEGLITAVGCLPGLSPGESLILTGGWTTHASYGEQFKAEYAERRLPVGREAIYAYLASGSIRNIGPSKARDIVEKFGEEALSVIEHTPEKLAEIRGISPRSAQEVGAAFRRQVGLRRLMEFLSEFAIRPLVAVRLYKRYGDEALEAVHDNPYVVAGEPYGADFYEADAMAITLGFEPDCSERVEAAVLFELEYNLNNGHTFLPYDKLVGATNQLIDVGRDVISDAVDALGDGGLIVREPVAGQDACYLALFQEAESFVADRLSAMASEPPAHDEAQTHRFVEAAERTYGISYAPAQLDAVSLAASSRVMVLTGGPGTGKTTCVRGILSLFDMMGLNTVLCAPTGRAAKRMSELTGRDAATVHRLLGVGPGEGDKLVFEHDESNPLRADAVIVDETSMVDILLMRALVGAMAPDCRLVLVGDADQLPSVGPGNVFSDIIRSGAVPAVVLTEIFRQAKKSGIVRNAHLINQGETPDFTEKSADFFFLKRGSADKTLETLLELVAERLPGNMGISPSHIQVLSPTRKNTTGTDNLNARLQQRLNPGTDHKKEKAYGELVFREGDKVMQIRNNYDIIWRGADGLTTGTGVFNGDIGFITEIDLNHETLTVDFEDKLVTYLFEQLGELELAYALTVHKSQGSEYKAVILAMSSGAPQLLVRSVLYTAVTRARELLIVVGDPGVAETMIRNDRRARRYSGLRARLSDNI